MQAKNVDLLSFDHGLSLIFKTKKYRAFTEWKFGLAKLIRNMQRTNVAPSPLNLATTWMVLIKTKIQEIKVSCSYLSLSLSQTHLYLSCFIEHVHMPFSNLNNLKYTHLSLAPQPGHHMDGPNQNQNTRD